MKHCIGKKYTQYKRHSSLVSEYMCKVSRKHFSAAVAANQVMSTQEVRRPQDKKHDHEEAHCGHRASDIVQNRHKKTNEQTQQSKQNV